MERMAFTLLFLGLLTGSAFAKDTEGTWKFEHISTGSSWWITKTKRTLASAEVRQSAASAPLYKRLQDAKTQRDSRARITQRAAAKIDGCSA